MKSIVVEGQQFDFQDDVPEQVMYQYAVKALTPVAVSDAAIGGLKGGWEHTKYAIPITGYRLLGDVTGNDEWKQKSVQLQQERDAKIEEYRPFGKYDFAAEAAYQTGMSAPESFAEGAAVIGATIATGGTALPVLGAAARAAKILGGVETLKQYGENRNEGMDVLPSVGHAAVHGAAEAIPEFWAAYMPLRDVAKAGGASLLRKAMQYYGYDIAGENMTTAAEYFNDALLKDKDVSLKDFVTQLGLTTVSSAVLGPVQTGVYAGANALLAPRKNGYELPEHIVEEQNALVKKALADVLNNSRRPDAKIYEDESELSSALERLRESRTKNISAIRQINPMDMTEDQLQMFVDFAHNRNLIIDSVRDRPHLRAAIMQDDIESGLIPPTIDNLATLSALEYDTSELSADEKKKLAAVATPGQGITTDTELRIATKYGEVANRKTGSHVGYYPQYDKLTVHNQDGSVVGGIKDLTAQVDPVTQLPTAPATRIAFDTSVQGLSEKDKQLGAYMEEFRKTFMPDANFTIMYMPASDMAAIAGDFAHAYASSYGKNQYTIALKQGTFDPVSKPWDVSTILHELGHVLLSHTVENLPPTLKRSIIAAWRSDVEKTGQLPFDAGKSIMQQIDQRNSSNGRLEHGAKDKTYLGGMEVPGPSDTYPTYYLSLPEWMAENFVKYVRSRGLFTTDKNFREAIEISYNKMAEFMSTMHDDQAAFTPNAALGAILDTVYAKSPGIKHAPKEERIARLQDAVKSGKLAANFLNGVLEAGALEMDLEALERITLQREHMYRTKELDYGYADALANIQLDAARFPTATFENPANILRELLANSSTPEAQAYLSAYARLGKGTVMAKDFFAVAYNALQGAGRVNITIQNNGYSVHFPRRTSSQNPAEASFSIDTRDNAINAGSKDIFQFGYVLQVMAERGAQNFSLSIHDKSLIAFAREVTGLQGEEVADSYGDKHIQFNTFPAWAYPVETITKIAQVVQDKYTQSPRNEITTAPNMATTAEGEVLTRELPKKIWNALPEKTLLQIRNAHTRAALRFVKNHPEYAPFWDAKTRTLGDKISGKAATDWLAKGYNQDAFVVDTAKGTVERKNNFTSYRFENPQAFFDEAVKDSFEQEGNVQALAKELQGLLGPQVEAAIASAKERITAAAARTGDTNGALTAFVKADYPPTASETIQMLASMPYTDLANGMNSIGGSVKPLASGVAKINWLMEKAAGLFQVLILNKENVNAPMPVREGSKLTLEGFRNRKWYRDEIAKEFDGVINAIMTVPKDEANLIWKLIYEEAETGVYYSKRILDPQRPGRYVFKLNDGIAAKFKLSERGAEIYSMIRDSFAMVLDENHRMGMFSVARNFGLRGVALDTLKVLMQKHVPTTNYRMHLDTFLNGSHLSAGEKQQAMEQLDGLDKDFENMRNTAYAPYMRFGQWAFKVVDKFGATVEMQTFEGEWSRNAGSKDARKRFGPTYAIKEFFIKDVPFAYAGMPASMINVISDRLELTAAQKAEYRQMLLDFANPKAFAKHLKKKAGIAGFSDDALRAISQYGNTAANNAANIKAADDIAKGLDMLKGFAQSQREQMGVDANTDKLDRLVQMIERQQQYLAQPGNDFAKLKHFMSIWHFGFNLSSALVQGFQVPFVTVPYMTERYGIPRTIAALQKSWREGLTWSKKNIASFTPDEVAFIENAFGKGFMNESLQAELARASDTSILYRAHAPLWAQRLGHKIPQWAMFPFQYMENLNRFSTALAVYRLEKQKGNIDPTWGFDQDAAIKARDAVDMTQFEYSRENRSVLMQGNRSVIFQFMQYQLGMLFNMFKGDASWWRMWIVLLPFAGIFGLPFADDAKDFAKWLARNLFDKDFDAQYEFKKLFGEQQEVAELFSRGVFSNLVGFDVSARISLGDVIPGTKALASNQDFNATMQEGWSDLGGPTVGVLTRAIKMAMDQNPDGMKNFEQIAPSSIRQIIRTVRAGRDGSIKDAQGATLYEPSAGDMFGYAVGFTPKDVSRRYEARSIAQEAFTYWENRREQLLKFGFYTHFFLKGDREAVADFNRQLQEFNADIPDKSLAITGDTIRASFGNKLKGNAMVEANMARNRAMRMITYDVNEELGLDTIAEMRARKLQQLHELDMEE